MVFQLLRVERRGIKRSAWFFSLQVELAALVAREMAPRAYELSKFDQCHVERMNLEHPIAISLQVHFQLLPI